MATTKTNRVPAVRQIYAYLVEHGPSLPKDIARALNLYAPSVRALLVSPSYQRLFYVADHVQDRHYVAARYAACADGEVAPLRISRPSPYRDAVIVFMRGRGAMTVADVARGVGMEPNVVVTHVHRVATKTGEYVGSGRHHSALWRLKEEYQAPA